MNGFTFEDSKAPENALGERSGLWISLNDFAVDDRVFHIVQSNASSPHPLRGVNTDLVIAFSDLFPDELKVDFVHKALSPSSHDCGHTHCNISLTKTQAPSDAAPASVADVGPAWGYGGESLWQCGGVEMALTVEVFCNIMVVSQKAMGSIRSPLDKLDLSSGDKALPKEGTT